jgi:membrane-bound lytic murein transglycosylase MltF
MKINEVYEQVLSNVSSNKNQVNSNQKDFQIKIDDTASVEKRYDALFFKASQAYQLPFNLIKAVAKAESDFNPNIVSHSGAQGLMQLMPSTAKALGVTDAFDPEQNIMGGAKFLRQMLDRFNGDTKLALAAYNAGPYAVKKYGGIPPYTETQKYVPKVLAYAQAIEKTSVMSIPTQVAERAPQILSKEAFRKENLSQMLSVLPLLLNQNGSQDNEASLITDQLMLQLALNLNDKKQEA